MPPLSTRTTAVSAALLLIGGLLSFGPAWRHLDRADERYAQVLAIGMAATPPAPRLLPVDETMNAQDQVSAEARLAASIRDDAGRGGLLIESIGVSSVRQPALAARRISLSGSEPQLLKFVEAIENRRPLVRFARWQLAPMRAGGGTVRLDADAVAVWGQRP